MSITEKTRGKVVSGKSQIIDGIGTAPGSGVTSLEGMGDIHTTVVDISGVATTMTDNLTKLYGGELLYTFPEGSICILGATADLGIVVSANLKTGADGDFSLGTITADSGAALTGADASIIPVTTVTCVSFIASPTGRTAATIVPQDGTSAATTVYLNYAWDTGAYTDAGIVTTTGTVTIVWAQLGDY